MKINEIECVCWCVCVCVRVCVWKRETESETKGTKALMKYSDVWRRHHFQESHPQWRSKALCVFLRVSWAAHQPIFNKLHEPKSLCFDYIYVYIRKEGINSVKKKKKTMELRTQNSDLRTVVLLYQQGWEQASSLEVLDQMTHCDCVHTNLGCQDLPVHILSLGNRSLYTGVITTLSAHVLNRLVQQNLIRHILFTLKYCCLLAFLYFIFCTNNYSVQKKN